MVFSNTTNKNGVIQVIERITHLGDGAITGNTTQFAWFTNSVNYKAGEIGTIIWMADKNWNYDDKNYTTAPNPTTTLVANQRDYSMPTTLLRLRSVEVMDNNGDYYELDYLKHGIKDLPYERWQEDAGLPTSYYLEGNSLILYPKPKAENITTEEGLRVWLDRSDDQFTVADTTQEPGFSSNFHIVLPLMVSMEWAGMNGQSDIYNYCKTELYGDGKIKEGLIDQMKFFYSNRNEDNRTIMQSKAQRTINSGFLK